MPATPPFLVRPIGLEHHLGAQPGGQRHHPHDAFGIDAPLVAFAHPDVALKATGQFGQLGRSTGVQAQFIYDGNFLCLHNFLIAQQLTGRTRQGNTVVPAINGPLHPTLPRPHADAARSNMGTFTPASTGQPAVWAQRTAILHGVAPSTSVRTRQRSSRLDPGQAGLRGLIRRNIKCMHKLSTSGNTLGSTGQQGWPGAHGQPAPHGQRQGNQSQRGISHRAVIHHPLDYSSTRLPKNRCATSLLGRRINHGMNNPR